MKRKGDNWRETYTTQVNGNHLVIMRLDGQPIRCEWDILQRIKNDVLGPDVTAMEVYPSVVNEVREINARHLFIIENPPEGFHQWKEGIWLAVPPIQIRATV